MGYFPKWISDLIVTSSSTTLLRGIVLDQFLYVAIILTWSFTCFILQLVKQYYANSAHSNNESASRRFPILMLNITVPASSVDVNLTPDKLQVMLQNKVSRHDFHLHRTRLLLSDIPQTGLIFSIGHAVFTLRMLCF